MSVAERIYNIMRQKKMKQSLVAKDAGYDIKSFNAMLRGRKKITERDIVPIARSLGVTPNDLFGITSPDNN